MGPGLTKSKVRIFLVDDHPIVRRGIQLLIGMEPDLMVCGEAEDAPTALEKITHSKPDLVIVDLGLKRGSGLDLIRQLRTNSTTLRILVLSMQDEIFYGERAVRAGANGYLTKDEGTEKVVVAIRQLLQGKRYFSEQIAAKIVEQAWSGHAQAQKGAIESLSDRELEVLNLLGQGLGSREIAGRLNVSVKTVESHREHIKEKLGLKSAAELVHYAFNWAKGSPAPDTNPDPPA